MRAFLAIVALLLRAEINVAAEEVDIEGHCHATDSSLRCQGSGGMPAELAEWIFREGDDEDSAEKYKESDTPGERKCYEDSDVARINGVSGARLYSLEVRPLKRIKGLSAYSDTDAVQTEVSL